MEKIIVANWKMNGSREFVMEFFKNFNNNTANQIIFCPPTLYINTVKEYVSLIGGQDCSVHNSGAFTGEISASMLVDVGCRYVIVGHSERRQYYQDSNEIVRAKAEQAINSGLIPIICIGESQEIRHSNKAIEYVVEQLSASVPLNKHANYLVAYEPIWAIGTGLTATSDDIIEMHNAIYKALPNPTTPILYGGSVNKDNAYTILSLPAVSGVLVGGASLRSQDLNHIVAFSEQAML
ncbi:triose-phosphate isomerase [Candidatus Odyssella thessalonicensis]|uniref:triose-phosphate isomerase n=1 Tax=Candidatus Odyssella thessalonicensis TaxID=84647 RepID=UPI000225B8FD|nr:triose-phosphate isomerase [Candidatus Odyssella thessalonicensis]